MSDRTLALTRRRLLGGLAVVGGASTAAGPGTVAYLTDGASSTDNAIEAGTLDLALAGSDATVQFLSAGGVVLGEDGSVAVTLRRKGTVRNRAFASRLAGTLTVAASGNKGGKTFEVVVAVADGATRADCEITADTADGVDPSVTTACRP